MYVCICLYVRVIERYEDVNDLYCLVRRSGSMQTSHEEQAHAQVNSHTAIIKPGLVAQQTTGSDIHSLLLRLASNTKAHTDTRQWWRGR
jgi:hypothetical protein